MANRSFAPKPDADGDVDEPFEPSGNVGEVAKHYGWLHTIDALVGRTPGVNEDMVRKWDLMRFFGRLKYLADIDKAQRLDAEIAKQHANQR